MVVRVNERGPITLLPKSPSTPPLMDVPIPEPLVRFTEAQLLAALRDRHAYRGNGGAGRWGFLTHVRTGAAFDQQEIDGLAVGLWPSDHHDIHAFEIKCSRSDWLREIQPTTYKSQRTRTICDTFTIVAPKGVVHDEELPNGWGLIEATFAHDGKIRLRQSVKAKRIGDPPANEDSRTIARGFLAAILRATGSVPGMTTGHKRRAVPVRGSVKDPKEALNG